MSEEEETEDKDDEETKNAGKRNHPTESRRYTKKMKGTFNLKSAQTAARIAMSCKEEAFFSIDETPSKVIEIAFPFIEGEYQLQKYLRNPEGFVVTSLRKKRVEIREKKLDPAEKELIRTAKGKEVREFINEKVVERLNEGEVVDPKDIMKMRFVLAWKKNEDGSKKGKARLGLEETCAPTLNKRSKQMLLQVVVQNQWKLQKGDVTAAFLQGRPLQRSKYALVPEELAEAMGLAPGEREVRLLKSVYGLTAAPLEWYAQVNTVLTNLGGVRTTSDPCVWVFKNPDTGNQSGIIGEHVDDFLIAGDNSPYWETCIKTLLAAFRWTPFEEKSFKQCGVQIIQNDGSVTQHQKEYLSTLSEVELSAERSKQTTQTVTESDRMQLTALLGGLQWPVTCNPNDS
jgi:hypothetical protein